MNPWDCGQITPEVWPYRGLGEVRLSDFRLGAAAYDSGDYEKAYRYWLPLAESGHMVAQKSIAVMFSKGHGVPLDLQKSAYWFQKAALQGHATAQYRLAMMLAFGSGVERDTTRGYVWLARAKAGFPPGINREKVSELSEMLVGAMTPAEKAAADEEIASLKAAGKLTPIAAPPRRLDPTDPEGFKRTVVDFMRRTKLSGDTLFAGTVQILGLDTVREKLGAGWEKVRLRVQGVVDDVIELHLTELDLYVRVSDEKAILVFGSALKPEAERTAQAIARDIEHRLTDLLPGGIEVSVHSISVPIDPGKDGNALSSLDALTRTVAASTRKVESSTREAAAKAGDAAKLAYWPVINLRHRTVSLYDARYKADISDMSGLDKTMLAAELDNRTLVATGQDLGKSGGLHRKAVMLTPVHFETLANKNFRTKFLDLCRKLPPVSSRRMVLHLVDLPEGTPQGRLFQILNIVAPFFLGFACRVSPKVQALERFAGMKLLILTVDGSRLSPLGRADLLDLFNLAERAKKKHMRLWFQGAGTLDVALTAKRIGVSYINGPTVIPETTQFGRVFRVN